MIKFYCYSCGQKIGVPLEVVGKRVKCPSCSTANAVPAPKETAAPKPPKRQYVEEPPALPSGMDVNVLTQIEQSGKRLTGAALKKFLREKRAGKGKK